MLIPLQWLDQEKIEAYVKEIEAEKQAEAAKKKTRGGGTLGGTATPGGAGTSTPGGGTATPSGPS